MGLVVGLVEWWWSCSYDNYYIASFTLLPYCLWPGNVFHIRVIVHVSEVLTNLQGVGKEGRKETLVQAAEEYLVSEIIIVIIDGEGRVLDPPPFLAPPFLYFLSIAFSLFPSFLFPLSFFPSFLLSFFPSFPPLTLIVNSNL